MSELSVWDLDGTLRPGSLLAEAISHGVDAGFIDSTKFGDITTPTYGEVDYFVQSLVHRSRHDFRGLMDRLSDEARGHCYEWSLEELDTQEHPIILSHSPDFLVRAFGRGLNVRHATGSYYHTKDSVFSGRAVTRHKTNTLSRYLRTTGIQHVAFAAGDSEADIPILHRAERAVVVNPYQPLADYAIRQAWEIVELPHGS